MLGDDRDLKEAEKCDSKPKNTTKLNEAEIIFPTENKIRQQCNPFLRKTWFSSLHFTSRVN